MPNNQVEYSKHQSTLAKAKNRTTSEKEMLIIAAGSNVQARIVLSKNPAISQRVISMLMQDKSMEVRKNLASNLNLTEGVINVLLENSRSMANQKVILKLARNPALPAKHIRLMATTMEYTRGILAVNPNCPPDVLAFLYEKDIDRRKWGRYDDGPSLTGLHIVKHKNCPLSVLIHAAPYDETAKTKVIAATLKKYPELEGLPEDFILRANGSGI